MMSKLVRKIAALAIFLIGTSTCFADKFIVGPGIDQNGDKTGNWVVYKVDDDGRITTQSVHKKKARAEQKADELNASEGDNKG